MDKSAFLARIMYFLIAYLSCSQAQRHDLKQENLFYLIYHEYLIANI